MQACDCGSTAIEHQLRAVEEGFRFVLASRGPVELVDFRWAAGHWSDEYQASFSDGSDWSWGFVGALDDDLRAEFLRRCRVLFDARRRELLLFLDTARRAMDDFAAFGSAVVAVSDTEVRSVDQRYLFPEGFAATAMFVGISSGDAIVDVNVLQAAHYEYSQDLAKAEERAEFLLREWLSPEQLTQLEANNYFEVTGSASGKRYRICRGHQMNVYELKKGRRVKGWCFGPIGAMTKGDVMLAQKIALETDEKAALAVANPFWADAGGESLRTQPWLFSLVTSMFGGSEQPIT